MKLLLINAPYPFFNEYCGNYADIPLRFAYLSAALKQIEHDILDVNIESITHHGISKHTRILSKMDIPSSRLRYFLNSSGKKEKKEYLYWLQDTLRNNLQGITHVGLNGDKTWTAFLIAEIVKSIDPNIITFVGGRRASDRPHAYLDVFDYVVKGLSDKSLDKLGSRPSSKIIESEGCSSILTPDYSNIALDKYFKIFNYVNLISSFGCSNSCSFCNYCPDSSLISRNYSEVIEEIKWFKNKHGISNFIFLDCCINNNKIEFMKLVNELRKQNIRWQGTFIAKGLSKEDITLIAKSGCIFATFGLENPSRRLLKKLGKRLEPKESMRIARFFQKKKILVRGTFIYDIPGERMSDFLRTASMRHKLDFMQMHKLTFHHGTKLFRSRWRLRNSILRTDEVERIRSRGESSVAWIKEIIAERINTASYKRFNNDKRLRKFTYKRYAR